MRRPPLRVRHSMLAYAASERVYVVAFRSTAR